MTGLQVSEQITMMTLERDESEWEDILRNLDIQRNYDLSFAALVCTWFSAILPSFISSRLLNHLAYRILRPDDAEFMLNRYYPQIKVLQKGIKVSWKDSIAFTRMFIGMITKIIYSFLWNEARNQKM